MTKTQIFLQNFCHGQICCPKTLESRKKPAENKQTAKAVCYLSRYSYSTVYNSYIAQTRVYRSYFEDPNNRRWFEKKYGFKVYKPKRYLVVGRRNDFECDEWIEIKSDYTDVEIVTYDDLVDTVVSQFYQ